MMETFSLLKFEANGNDDDRLRSAKSLEFVAGLQRTNREDSLQRGRYKTTTEGSSHRKRARSNDISMFLLLRDALSAS